MITDEQIKDFVAPEIQRLRGAGYTIYYMDDNAIVSLSNRDFGIKIRYHSDINGWVEYDLTSEQIYRWATPPLNLAEFKKRFYTKLNIINMGHLIDQLNFQA